MDHETRPPQAANDQLLGVATAELGNISVDELMRNRVALRMLLVHFTELKGENTSLRTEINSQRTYVDAYFKLKDNSLTISLLYILANILLGIGINLVTANSLVWLGILLIALGVGVNVYATVLNLKKG